MWTSITESDGVGSEDFVPGVSIHHSDAFVLQNICGILSGRARRARPARPGRALTIVKEFGQELCRQRMNDFHIKYFHITLPADRTPS